MRLFIALEIPKEISRQIYIKSYNAPIVMTRLKEKNMHITLFFFKDLSGENTDHIINIINHIHTKAFNVSIRDINVFSKRNPRVIFREISEGKDKILKLYKMLATNLDDMDVPIDTHKLFPHITIGRIHRMNKEIIGSMMDYIQTNNNNNDDIKFICNRISLFTSTLTQTAALHSRITTKRFTD